MNAWIHTIILLLAVATLVPAVISDVRVRRIPNSLCLAGLLAALCIHGYYGGTDASLLALGAALLALALTFPLFAIGWFGAGDVKLIAAMGAMAGTPSMALGMLVAIALAGALFALSRHHWQRRKPRQAVVMPAYSRRGVAQASNAPTFSTSNVNALPYAVAIATGSLTVLLAQALGYS